MKGSVGVLKNGNRDGKCIVSFEKEWQGSCFVYTWDFCIRAMCCIYRPTTYCEAMCVFVNGKLIWLCANSLFGLKVIVVEQTKSSLHARSTFYQLFCKQGAFNSAPHFLKL